MPSASPDAKLKQNAARGRDISTIISYTTGLKGAAVNAALAAKTEPMMPGGAARAQALLHEAPQLIREGAAVDEQLRSGKPAGDMPATTGYGAEKHRDWQSSIAKALEFAYRGEGAIADKLFKAKEENPTYQAQAQAKAPGLDPAQTQFMALHQQGLDLMKQTGASLFNADAPTLGDVFRREAEKRAVPIPAAEQQHPWAKAVADAARSNVPKVDAVAHLGGAFVVPKMLNSLMGSIAEPMAEPSDRAVNVGGVNVSPGRAQAAGALTWLATSPETKLIGPAARALGAVGKPALAPAARLVGKSKGVQALARVLEGNQANIRQAADVAGVGADPRQIANELLKVEPRANMLLRDVERTADAARNVAPSESRQAFQAMEGADPAQRASALQSLSPEAQAAVAAKQALAGEYLQSGQQTLGMRGRANYVEHVESPEAAQARLGVQTAAPPAAARGTMPGGAAQFRKARDLPAQLTREATPKELLRLEDMQAPDALQKVQAAEARYQREVLAPASGSRAAPNPLVQGVVGADPRLQAAVDLARQSEKKALLDALRARAPQERYNQALAKAQAGAQGMTRPAPIATVPEVNDAILRGAGPTAAGKRAQYGIAPGSPTQDLRVFQEDLGKSTVQRYAPAAQERSLAEFLDTHGRQFTKDHVVGQPIPAGWTSIKPAPASRSLLSDVLNKGVAPGQERLVPTVFKDVFEPPPVQRGAISTALAPVVDPTLNAWKALVTVLSGPAYHFRNNAWSAAKSAERFGAPETALSHLEAAQVKAGGQGLVQGLPADAWKKAAEEWGNLGMGGSPASKVAELREKFGLPGPPPKPGMMSGIAAKLEKIPGAPSARKAVKLPGKFAEASDSQARLAAALAEFRRTGGKGGGKEGAFEFANDFINQTRHLTPLERSVDRVSPFGKWTLRELINPQGVLSHVAQGGGTLPAKAKALAEALVPPQAQVPEKYQNARGRQGMAIPTGAMSDAGLPYYLNQPWSVAGLLQPLDPAYRLLRGEGPVAAGKSALDEGVKFLAPQIALGLQAGLGRRSLTGADLGVLGKASPIERSLYEMSPSLAPHVVEVPQPDGSSQYKSKGLATLAASAVPLQQYLRVLQSATPLERARALQMILGLTHIEQDPSLAKVNVKKDWREKLSQQRSDTAQLTGLRL
jgi:hypothetical protein